MKTKILVLLFILSGVSIFSQSLEKLKSETKKIYDANYTMDFNTILALSYPKIVETIGKDAFLEKLDSDYQNEEYRMRLELVTPIYQYSEVKKIDDKTFCVIMYRNPIRYFFENKLNADTAAEKVTWLKERNTTPDVFFEPKRNSINVKRISKFIAVSDETTGNEWKFFNLDDIIQIEILKKNFSESIKKELGF